MVRWIRGQRWWLRVLGRVELAQQVIPFENYGGRRFLMTSAVLTTATVLQWFGKLDSAGTTYAAIVIGCVAAYITGNTTQKVKSGVPKDTP